MPGYKKTCRYCSELIPEDSVVCPICSKVNPLTSLRCPKCKNTVEKNWKKCNVCGLDLKISCPKCGKQTFFGDYCSECNERLLIICPNPKCKTEQPPIGEKCVKCGKPMKAGR